MWSIGLRSNRNTFDKFRECATVRRTEERSEMTVSRFTGLAVLAAAGAFAVAACGSDDNGGSSAGGGGSGGGTKTAAKDQRACVIMPDTDSSSRWPNGDTPALQKQFPAAGFKVDIQNAENDTSKYATIAQQQMAGG